MLYTRGAFPRRSTGRRERTNPDAVRDMNSPHVVLERLPKHFLQEHLLDRYGIEVASRMLPTDANWRIQVTRSNRCISLELCFYVHEQDDPSVFKIKFYGGRRDTIFSSTFITQIDDCCEYHRIAEDG